MLEAEKQDISFFFFRVWDKLAGKHLPATGLFIDCRGRIWQGSRLLENFDGHLIIERCTGLKDVSGNFIFENDVVRVNTYCDAQPEYKVILWKECYSGYLLTSCDLDGSYNFYYGGLEFSEKEAKEYVSIVGNVHTWQDKK